MSEATTTPMTAPAIRSAPRVKVAPNSGRSTVAAATTAQ